LPSTLDPILFQGMADAARDTVILMDDDGMVVYANPALTTLLGYTPDELLGRHLHDTLVPPMQRTQAHKGLAAFRHSGLGPMLGRTLELTAIHKNGQPLPIELSLSTLDHHGIHYALGILRDISPRTLAENTLRQHQRLEQALNRLSVLLAETDLDLNAGLAALGQASQADRAYLFLFDADSNTISNTHEWCAPGVTPQIDQMQRQSFEPFPWWMAHILNKRTLFIADVDAMPEEARAEQALLRRQHIRPLVVVPLVAPDGVIDGFMGFDDTRQTGRWSSAEAELLRTAAGMIGARLARDRSRRALQTSNTFLQAVLDHATIPIYTFDRQGRFTLVNRATSRHNGYSQEELVGMSLLDLLADDADRQRAQQAMKAVLMGREPMSDVPVSIRCKNGLVRHILVSGAPLDLPDSESVGVAYSEDITERLATEHERDRLTLALRILSGSNLALVQAEDESALIATVCRVVVESNVFQAAWVCAPVPPSNDGAEPLWGVVRTAAGIEPQQAARLLHNCHPSPLQEGFATCLVPARPHGALGLLPLRHNGQELGTLVLLSNSPDPFAPNTKPLLQELANNLAFGIAGQRLRAAEVAGKHALEQTLARIDQTLDGTVAAISAMVELRDPYTAGHERRVAALAGAIAQELGLDEVQQEGIRIGAMIHDIGKIQIPAEILSKPACLNELEVKLVQAHPEAGYQILKGIDFPWPIADITRQHHERLDGSGYPQGLKGDRIIIEARIVAVADVVEAISSHRPYRPSLGQVAALEQIQKGAGTLFDAEVVAACVRLFQEEHFVWPVD